jgi:hypothetical protein
MIVRGIAFEAPLPIPLTIIPLTIPEFLQTPDGRQKMGAKNSCFYILAFFLPFGLRLFMPLVWLRPCRAGFFAFLCGHYQLPNLG